MKQRTKIDENMAQWYQEVILEAGLIDNTPTRGAFALRPYGYALWENIKNIVDKHIKAAGVDNIYLPLLIPEAFLRKEKKHVEGFSPEVAVVTHAGGKKLDEPYVIRPTSETMVYHMFARWIDSWRDLPLKINQWANVVRWEMRTRAFLRSTEFLWQEGHTAHATKEEATQMALHMLKVYEDLAQDILAIPVVTGVKTESERFAGADATYTFEALMPDGKALQMGTSHILAQSFPAAFDVTFQDKDGTRKSPMCTSWAITTRLVGALVMTHGDDNGLVMPPRIAPIQVAIVPIYKSDEQRNAVLERAQQLKAELEKNNMRVVIDTHDQKTPGAKFYHWEVRGVPVRLELGPRDLENNKVVVVNRIEQDKAKKKQFISCDDMVDVVQGTLDLIQRDLYKKALEKRDAQWHQADKLEDFGKTMQKANGMYQVGWCGAAACEEQLKPYSGTIRCIIEKSLHQACFSCTKESRQDVLVAKAY